jgi:hypothetical protein
MCCSVVMCVCCKGLAVFEGTTRIDLLSATPNTDTLYWQAALYLRTSKAPLRVQLLELVSDRREG